MNYMDRFLAQVDEDIIEQQVNEVIASDANLAELLADTLEERADIEGSSASPELLKALAAAHTELRMRVDDEGRARATWVTIQFVPNMDELVLHVGVA